MLMPTVVRPGCRLTASPSSTSSCRPGVRLEDTAAVSAAAYRIIARQPEVANVVESIGGDDFGEVRTANLYIYARAARASAR